MSNNIYKIVWFLVSLICLIYFLVAWIFPYTQILVNNYSTSTFHNALTVDSREKMSYKPIIDYNSQSKILKLKISDSIKSDFYFQGVGVLTKITEYYINKDQIEIIGLNCVLDTSNTKNIKGVVVYNYIVKRNYFKNTSTKFDIECQIDNINPGMYSFEEGLDSYSVKVNSDINNKFWFSEKLN